MTIRVDRDAPTAALLGDMFRPFRATGLERHDLTITGAMEPMPEASHGETEYQYTESGIVINAMNVQILRDEDSFRLNGSRELLVSALPLIDAVLVSRGVAMIHALTVDYDGVGVCMPAWGGVGKTSTMAKLLRIPGVSFMGDDWAFLTEDSQLLGYAKPMFIKPHHRPIYPHLFAKKRKPLVPVRLSRPLGRLTTLVHPVITQYPRLARATRKLSPEHMMVTPQAAFPAACFSDRAPLGVALFVERFDGAKGDLQERDQAWMVSRLVGNFHAELSRFSRETMTALGATGLVPIERFFADKAAILERSLDGKPCYLLKVPASLSPDQASDTIVAQIQALVGRAGAAAERSGHVLAAAGD
jgi:hypothetical protein